MSISKKPTENSKTPPGQLDKFRDLARELQADEDPVRFEETLKRIAKRGAPEPEPEVK